MSIEDCQWLWIVGLSKTARWVEGKVQFFFISISCVIERVSGIIVLTGAYRPMILRYSSNPTGKSRTKCKFFFRWPIFLYCFYTELACISNLSSLSLLLLLDIAFLLIMLLFFLFLVSGHYGPDAFFNSGCKCMLIFSDYLINHQKFALLIVLDISLLEGRRKIWLNNWSLRKINMRDLIELFFCLFQGQHHCGRQFQQQPRLMLIPIQLVETFVFLMRNSLFPFSTKIQPKQWEILLVNWTQIWSLLNPLLVEVSFVDKKSPMCMRDRSSWRVSYVIVSSRIWFNFSSFVCESRGNEPEEQASCWCAFNQSTVLLRKLISLMRKDACWETIIWS